MAGRAEQSGGRDEVWCSVAVIAGERVNLGPADCDGGSEKSTDLVVVQKNLRL